MVVITIVYAGDIAILDERKRTVSQAARTRLPLAKTVGFNQNT